MTSLLTRHGPGAPPPTDLVADPPPAVAGPESEPAAPPVYRVLKIAPTCFFADYGCHVRILEETLALQAGGHRVTLCTYDLGRDVPGLDIRRAARLPWRDGVHTGPTWQKLYVDALMGLRAAGAALREQPHLVHAHLHEGALVGACLAAARDVPLIFDFQGSLTAEMLDHNFISQRHPLFPLLAWLEQRINRVADAVITSSHNAARLLVEQFGLPASRVHTLPDCVNTDRFQPRWVVDPVRVDRLRQRLGIPLDRQVVAYLGLLAEYQGCSQLLTAAKHILGQRQDVHFVMMGYPGEERYRRTARDLGIEAHVTFTGRVDYEAAPEYLCLGDIATSPKLSLTEANGKLLNYMAVGLPTVAYDTPVAREILGPLGRYARRDDHIDLANQLMALLDDPNRDAVGRQLRERAEADFAWHDNGRRLAAIYAAVLAERRQRRRQGTRG